MRLRLRYRLIRPALGLLALALLVIAGSAPGPVAMVLRAVAILAALGWIAFGLIVARFDWRKTHEPIDPPAPVTRAAIRAQTLYGIASCIPMVVIAGIALALSFVYPEAELALRIGGIVMLVFAVATIAALFLGLHRMRRRLAAGDA